MRFGKRKNPIPKETPQPRELKELKAEHETISAQAGAAQYQVHIFGKELARLNQQLESLNYEAAARNKLDAEAKAVGAKND